MCVSPFRLDCVVVFTSRSTQNSSFRQRFPQANLSAWYGKKLNLTQQKHAFVNQKKCTTTHKKTQKTTAGFSRLLRHPAWKRSVSIPGLPCGRNFYPIPIPYPQRILWVSPQDSYTHRTPKSCIGLPILAPCLFTTRGLL